MRYFDKYTVNKFCNTYSCDMVRLSIKVKEKYIQHMSDLVNLNTMGDINYYMSFGQNRYKHMYIAPYGESTVTIGIGFNGYTREDALKGFIEFNPNKVFPEFEVTLLRILECCSACQIARCDIAIDIPHSRQEMRLLKTGNKTYTRTERKSITEYLGQRSKCGFVKLYDKTEESELDYPLTRLEITTECDYEMFLTHVPDIQSCEICGYDALDGTIGDLSVTQSQFVKALNLLDNENRLMILNGLNRNIRQKIEPHCYGTDLLYIDYEPVAYILERIKEFENIIA